MNSIAQMPETAAAPPFLGFPEEGPITRQRKLRTRILYSLCVIVGLLPTILGASAAWQAAGLGLLFPGAGFFAAGGWALVLVPVVLVLYGVSLIAWFGSGMVVAPVLVWLGSAALAAALAGSASWAAGLPIAVVLLVLFRVMMALRKRKADAALRARREERAVFLPDAVAAVAARATPAPAPGERELTLAQVQALRYNFDLALQPVESFDGFQSIEQFQTSALRYQLNNIGYTLGVMQAMYTPNFHGYINQAQRNVIEKALDKRVWGYWRWERLWGHFSTRFDPVGKDNIMLTGFIGVQIGLYIAATGDMRYAEPGSLTFRWGKHAFAHDIHSIIRSIDENYSRNDFCLYPCEPGWIYTPCNFMGMMALMIYDRTFGTAYAAKHMPAFMQGLDKEFTLADGDLIALRSELTGSAIPFPFGNEGQPLFINALAPERARKAWALARREYVVEKEGGGVEITGLEKGVDFGLYRKSPIGHLYHLLASASEMGDAQVADEIVRLLNQLGGPTVKDGVLKYDCSSTTGTGLVRALILGSGDWLNTVKHGQPDASRKGPMLTGAAYPQVMVAKAFSHGEDLELVMYPGQGDGVQSLTLEQLHPARHYQLTVAGVSERFQADASGTATVTVALAGRTQVFIQPE